MKDAVIVNPYPHEEVSEGLKRALTMGQAERIARWTTLMDGVRRSDVKVWRDSFVEALREAGAQNAQGQRHGNRETSRLPRQTGLQPHG